MQQFMLTIALMFATTILAQTTVKSNPEDKGQTIKVSVLNALSDNGTIHFAFHSKETFMKSAAVYSKSSKVEKGVVIVAFENVSEGEYAIICFHDENENGQMDFEFNGMPKESYGTSNNPLIFGPPQFESSKFKVKNENLNLEIKF